MQTESVGLLSSFLRKSAFHPVHAIGSSSAGKFSVVRFVVQLTRHGFFIVVANINQLYFPNWFICFKFNLKEILF